jgi:hypothetical protein
MAGRNLSPEEREAADLARRETVEQLHQQLAEGIANLDNRDAWQRYLRFARGFTNYSMGNQLLIMLSKPDATAVAGYRVWQAKGYQVRRGEKAIRILGPVTRPVPLLDAAGHLVLDEHGRPRRSQEIIGVRPVSVFDISSCDGPPMPEPPTPTLLTGEAPAGLWDSLAGVVAEHGFKLERGDCGGANGVTSFGEQVVRVRDDVDDAQAVKTLAHELGHVLLTDPSDVLGFVDCRGLREVEAESVAFMVTAAHGLDSSQYTFNYVTGWASRASGDLTTDQVVKATGERVISAVDQILSHTQPAASPGERALVALEADIDRGLANVRPRWGAVNFEPGPGAQHERLSIAPDPGQSLGIGR